MVRVLPGRAASHRTRARTSGPNGVCYQKRPVTQRKPPGVPWESWIDRQIRRAQERGEFEDLPGAGQPLQDLDRRFDEISWVKEKLRREQLSYMAPSVALRKQVHDALQAASRAASEAEVRQLIAEINGQIRDANRKGIRGPSLMLMPFDADRVVREWRRRRSRKKPDDPSRGARMGEGLQGKAEVVNSPGGRRAK